MWMMLYCKTAGKLFADTRNLGYTLDNILVAGPRRYVNKSLLVHNGKSLEAVWHRAVLDLLAAVALIDHGRLAGHLISYKAGHAVDCDMIRLLYQRDLLEEI
jgi:UDP-3-O-acyl-N-acetylglucosamine deacetylase